jgi:hypothetical protein
MFASKKKNSTEIHLNPFMSKKKNENARFSGCTCVASCQASSQQPMYIQTQKGPMFKSTQSHFKDFHGDYKNRGMFTL